MDSNRHIYKYFHGRVTEVKSRCHSFNTLEPVYKLEYVPKLK
jgi:hypothetical protein